MNIINKIITAFCSDIRLALALDPPTQMKYGPLMHNQIFFLMIRAAIMSAICVYTVLLICMTISYLG